MPRAGAGSSRRGDSRVLGGGQLEGNLPSPDSQAVHVSALGTAEAPGSQPSAPRLLPPGQGGPPWLASPPPIILRNTLPIASFLHPGGALQVKGKGNLNGVQREGMLSLGKWKVEPGWRNLVLTVPVCSLDSKQETPVKCPVSKAGKKPTKSNTASKP